MKWYYWRTKDEWTGIVEAHNGKYKWTWVPECGYWCWPEEAVRPDITVEDFDRMYEENGHWVRTSPLEYLIRQGEPLPPPPPPGAEYDERFDELLKERGEINDNSGNDD